MCVIGSGGFAHFAEYLTWLMGYETLCYSLFDKRDLVAAVSERLFEYYRQFVRRLLGFDRVKLIWGEPDGGAKSIGLEPHRQVEINATVARAPIGEQFYR